MQDPELFRYPASRDQSRTWRLVLSAGFWFHQMRTPNISNQDNGFEISDTTETAHVCTAAQYREAVNNPDLGMGFPIKDVRFLGAQQNEAANSTEAVKRRKPRLGGA